MPYDVVQAHDLPWKEREPMHGQQPRSHASITDAARLMQSRAQMWRYPAHTRGRRHIDPDQEEVFVPLRGTLTVLVEEPPKCIDVEPGGVIAVHPGTPMQLRNETDEEILVFAYGAPPISGNVQFLDDVAEIERPEHRPGLGGSEARR
jgi:quercetin dioxygenase-like cupin family protein